MPPKPTSIRYAVLAATFFVSIFMYVDRVCLAGVKGDIQRELAIESWQMDWVLGAFFWSYALAQVAGGVLGTIFGLRRMLAIYLFLWSLFTAVAGVATGLLVLIVTRLLVGLCEAGAYPTMAALIKRWFPPRQRGVANGAVALGGRFGGALGQRITPLLVVSLAGVFGLAGWRVALLLFGVLGMTYAAVFWFIARDSAKRHPWANDAEADLVTDAPAGPPPTFPWRAILSSRNLWLSGTAQFGINIGWAFVITNLPDYLEMQHGVTGDDKGYWSSWPLLVGMAGMFAGGFLTDWLTARIGRRWGRALPIGVSLVGCALAYFGCAYAADYRIVVGLLCLMAIFVDIGVPAIWAFAQDIGGQHVGAALGWGNMLGNIGAGLSPVLLGALQRSQGYPTVFVACAAAFAVAAVAALNMNAAVPLQPDDPEPKLPLSTP